MAIDACIIVVGLLKDFGKFHRCLGKVFDMERYVLDESSGARTTCAANSGEDARTHRPPGTVFRRVGGEICLFKQTEGLYYLKDFLNVLFEFGFAVGFGFKQKSREPFAGGIIDRRKRLLVKKFTRIYRSLLAHGHHRTACLGKVIEIEHSRRAERETVNGLHGGLGHEGKSAFAAHYTVGDYLEGIIIIDKGENVESGDIFYRILIFDKACQLAVAANSITDGTNFINDITVSHHKRRARLIAAGIEYRSVGKHNHHRLHEPIGISMHAAVHTRGVVDDYSAHHGRLF